MLKNIFSLLSGSVLSQVITLLMIPILTRIYAPEEFGLYSIFTTVVLTVCIIATLRLEFSILLPSSKFTSINILNASCLNVVITSLVLLLIVVILILFTKIPLYFLLLPLAVFFNALSNLLLKYLNRENKYLYMTFWKIIFVSFNSFFAISLYFSFKLLHGMIYSYVFASLIAYAYLKFKVPLFRFRRVFDKNNFLKYFVVCNKYSDFIKFNMPHALFNQLSTSSIVLIIPIFFTLEELGYYAIAHKTVFIPVSIITMTLFNILNNELSNSFKNNESMLNKIVSIVPYQLTGIILSIPFFVYIDDLYRVLFGNSWDESAVLVKLMFPWITSTIITAPMMCVFIILTKQKEIFAFEIFSFLIRVFTLFVCSNYFSFTDVFLIFSVVSSVLILFQLTWVLNLIFKHHKSILKNECKK